MYNRYISNGASYTRIPEEDAPPFRSPYDKTPSKEEHRPTGDTKSGIPNPLEGVTDFLGNIFKGFNLGDIDTGDILLVLIILFLFLESGDNLELVITLGLLLLFSLGDKKKEKEQETAED